MNGLGNLVFRSFAIPSEQIRLSPVEARRKRISVELASAEKHLCPALSEVISSRAHGKTNDDHSRAIVQDLTDKALAAIFLNHYGWTQFREVSLNPFKTLKSTLSGLRLIYDSHIEAAVSLPKTSICRRWFNLLPFCK